MSEHLQQLPPVSTAVITFAPVEELQDYRRHLDVPFPLLADPDRTLYRDFGLDRGSLREVWSASTLRYYRELMSQGRRLRLPVQDTRQLGGDFVLDGERRLVAAFRPRSPDARPAMTEIAGALAEAASST